MYKKIAFAALFALASTVASAPSMATTIIDFEGANADPYLQDGFQVDPARIVNGNCAAGSCLALNKNEVSTLTRVDGHHFTVSSFWFQLLGEKSGLTVTAFDGASLVGTLVLSEANFPHTAGQVISHLFSNITSLVFTDSAQKGNIRIDNINTPIPAALPLFGTGLAGLGFIARRRKAKTAAAA